ncbi:MAG: WD40 repeat domain-containing protein, partial [Anaerolineae bacterium]|nr:WD40 repeat domain-containing protein [Anaerolineae bacterium]
MTNSRAILVLWIAVLALCPRSLAAQSFTMSALQVSPDGSAVAVGYVDGQLQLYDASTGIVIRTLQPSGEYVYGLAWSPDGTRLATISFDGDVNVWEVQTGTLLISLNTTQAADIIPHTSSLTGVSWSPDGQQIAVSGQNGGTVVLDASIGYAVHRLERGETYGNTWAPLQKLVTSTYVGLYVWSSGTQNQFIPGIPPPGFIPYRVAYAPNGTSLAAIVTDYSLVGDNLVATGVLRLFDPVTLNPIASVDIFQHAAPPRMEWSSDATHIAISGTDGFVRVWEAESLELIDEIAIGSSYMAFDWLGPDQIVYVQDSGSLEVVPVEGITSDLTGTITLPSRTPGTAAYAVPLSVKLADAGGALVSEHSPTTDVNGTFTLQDLPQGTYGVWL